MNMLALQLHPMFRSLSDDARAQVLKLMVRRKVEPDTVIMKQGEAGDDMFVLKRGTCTVHVRGQNTNPDSHGKEVATLMEPDFFGDVALTQANALRTVSSFAPRHLPFSQLPRLTPPLINRHQHRLPLFRKQRASCLDFHVARFRNCKKRAHPSRKV